MENAVDLGLKIHEKKSKSRSSISSSEVSSEKEVQSFECEKIGQRLDLKSASYAYEVTQTDYEEGKRSKFYADQYIQKVAPEKISDKQNVGLTFDNGNSKCSMKDRYSVENSFQYTEEDYGDIKADLQTHSESGKVHLDCPQINNQITFRGWKDWI